MSTSAPSATPPHVNYILTSWVSGVVFIVTLSITCALYYHIVIVKSWRRWRFCRRILPGLEETEEEEAEEADDAESDNDEFGYVTRSEERAPGSLSTIDPTATATSGGVAIGPLPHQRSPATNYSLLDLTNGDAQLITSTMHHQQPPLAIDLETGQVLLDRFFTTHERSANNEGTIGSGSSNSHRNLNFKETPESRNPATKPWKCAWCGAKTSFVEMFKQLSPVSICPPRGVYVSANSINSRGFGGNAACHQRSKNDLSFDVMPLVIADANRRAFTPRVYKEYRHASVLFETHVIESPTTPIGTSYTYNVVDAYFDWIHPWGEYSDIDWVQRTRMNLYLPPTIQELIAQFDEDSASGRDVPMDMGDGDASKAAEPLEQSSTGNWMFTDNGSERSHISTTFIPFVVFITDVHK